MSKLSLKRPLVIFDLETTGTHTVTDRIVEIAAIRINPDGTRDTWERRVNPGVPIPEEVTLIHGISDEDVKDAPRFSQIAEEFRAFLDGCDIGGFNVLRFDLPFLGEEFKRAGCAFDVEGRALVDAQVIFHKMEPRTLEAALRYYCGAEHTSAHSALGDVVATVDVLEAQLARYTDLPADVEGLHGFCDQRNPRYLDRWGKLVWREDEACLGFGPHRGRTLREVAERDRNFLQWILRKDFSTEVKEIVAAALAGNFPKRDGSEDGASGEDVGGGTEGREALAEQVSSAGTREAGTPRKTREENNPSHGRSDRDTRGGGKGGTDQGSLW